MIGLGVHLKKKKVLIKCLYSFQDRQFISKLFSGKHNERGWEPS